MNWSSSEIKKRYYNYIRDYNEYEINTVLVDEIIKTKANHIFEFGCNNGFNLTLIRKRDSTKILSGCDLSSPSIKEGIANGLNLVCYDENYFKMFENQFDLIFTCSVLCHIPEITDLINDMKKQTRRIIVCECDSEFQTEWFIHNYKMYDFEFIRSVLSPDKRNYNIYEWRKKIFKFPFI